MSAAPPPSLPVETLREPFLRALELGPVVLSSPTGSGKSTLVPQWCAAARGRVVVVQPRRVACRSLAARVAELRGEPLGAAVGYQVRDEARFGDDTRILFVTPGIALARFDELSRYEAVVLDELHERRLDTDLLLALLKQRAARGLVAMSATLDGERVAEHLGGRHLHVDVRLHPVEVRYLPAGALLPAREGLEARVVQALDSVADVPGDVLVFLPGKAEIAAVAEALRGRALRVLPLHGDLPLKQQSAVFASTDARKVILATNVAETSLTVPGVGVVIDSGLVRRTRYHQGRGFLTLAPIALDSAAQRAGRAGRTGPGVCVRCWAPEARLEARTPPEIHRESLVPLVLASAACGAEVARLPFLDAPKEHALEAATGELRALGALDATGQLTDCGRQLFGLPLDAHLGRLLIAAQGDPAQQDVVDLVAALSVGRPRFVGPPKHDDERDLRAAGCDAVAAVRLLRARQLGSGSAFVAQEARAVARRLRRAFGLAEVEGDPPVDGAALARVALRADPRCAHVARRRGKRLAWSNGGTEIELSRDSAVQLRLAAREGDEPPPEAIVVLDTRALASGRRGPAVVATCALPVSLGALADAGLGRERVVSVRLERGALVAEIERVYAKKVLTRTERAPEGALAREGIAQLFTRGSLWRDALEEARRRLSARALAAQLAQTDHGRALGFEGVSPPPTLEEWARTRLQTLGVESGEDLALLDGDDLLPEDLPFELRGILDSELPREVSVGDALYAADYDLAKRQVILRIVRGQRKDPPPASYLPRFSGLKVFAEAGRTLHRVR